MTEAIAKLRIETGQLPLRQRCVVAGTGAFAIGRWTGRLGSVLLPVGFAVLVLAIWQFAVVWAKVPEVILPPPSAIYAQIADHWELLLQQSVPTAYETLLAFAISTPLGVLLAAAITWSPLCSKAIYPNVIVFQLIPKIALAPLFIVWLGIGSPSRVTFSVFISFFPILIATIAGLQAVPRDMLRLCRSVGATDWQVLTRVRFPMSLPCIFSGMKITATLSVIGIIVREFIASQAGLGYLILFASSREETDLSLACIAILCVIGLLLYGIIAAAEEWVKNRQEPPG
jgi:NitT/TauT family transport system permease protein